MKDNNKIVHMELTASDRCMLASAITKRVIDLDIDKKTHQEILDIWPKGNINTQPTLAQLFVIAKKLNMKINIVGLYMEAEK